MKNILIIILLIFLSAQLLTAQSGSCLSRWEEFSHTPEKTFLTEWIRTAAYDILHKKKISLVPGITLPAQPGCTGLFITLIKNGKVRGCYGAFNHRSNSPEIILIEYLKGALSLDPRHKPLERFEFAETEIVLTVTSNPEPVNDINNVDISNFGLFIDCEDSSKTIIVPAEYRTTSGIIKLTGNSRCRFYKFRGITIK